MTTLMKWRMEIKDPADWEEVRVRGYTRWVLRQGVAGWGIPLVVLVTAIQVLFFDWGLKWTRHELLSLLLVAILASILGIYLADREWGRADERFGGKPSRGSS